MATGGANDLEPTLKVGILKNLVKYILRSLFVEETFTSELVKHKSGVRALN